MSRRLLILVLSLMVSAAAHAQATRTWVSGVGDDANPCSRTNPCRTFIVAISKTAAGGEVDALDPGDFGPIQDDVNGRPGIMKSIIIDGGAARAAITFPGIGVRIDFTNSPDADRRVVLRNLRLAGLATSAKGVSIQGANQVDIEDVLIEGVAGGSGIDITPSAAVAVNLSRCTIVNNAVNGIVASGASASAPVQLSVKDSHIALNGTGIRLAQYSSLALSGSAVNENNSSGVVVGAGCDAHIDASMVALNGLAAVDNAGAARLSASEIVYNSTAFRGAAAVETHANNAVAENTGVGIGLPKQPIKVGTQ
jgi:hypothetical protein